MGMVKLSAIATIAAILAVSCTLAGCRHVETIIERPVYIHDTLRDVSVVHDSVRVERWHTVEAKGDTVVVHDSVAYVVDKTRVDTVYKVREVPVETKVKETETERPAPAWRRVRWGVAAVLAAALLLVVVLWRDGRRV